MRIKSGDGGIMDQQGYIEKMVIPEKTKFNGERDLTEKEMTLYRSEVGKLNWLSRNLIYLIHRYRFNYRWEFDEGDHFVSVFFSFLFFVSFFSFFLSFETFSFFICLFIYLEGGGDGRLRE